MDNAVTRALQRRNGPRQNQLTFVLTLGCRQLAITDPAQCFGELVCRLLKAVPYCVITLYLAKAIFDKHEQEFRTCLALPVLFDDPDIDISIARQRLLVSKCDMETAMHLDIPLGEPVAEVRRILCDANETILYVADVIYRGDYIQLDMNLLA